MAGLKIPIIAVVLGEGGSGGALAIGIGDKVLMMENSVYRLFRRKAAPPFFGRKPDKQVAPRRAFV
jgi:acetyl-CoA carboxylase carboxyl transferase subunit alpha